MRVCLTCAHKIPEGYDSCREDCNCQCDFAGNIKEYEMTQDVSETKGNSAIGLCVPMLFEPEKTCMKHLHNWRKTYFNERGIRFD